MDYAHCIRQAGRGTLWLCRPAIKLLVMCLLLMAGAWMAGLLAYRLPVTEPIRYALGVAVFIGTLGVAVATWFGHWKACGGFIVALGLSIWWWSSIHPSLDRNWAAEVSRMTHSNVTGDEVVVHNVRNFDWKSETDFAPRWEQRSYRLAELKSADLFLSYWAGEAMAHTILSFGFEQPGGIMSQLAFSFERRSQTGQVYSPVAGLFKEYELAAVGADERDIIRVRANVRGEDARLYRLNLTPHEVRSLFQEYLKAANQLAAVPRFYNT